MKSSFSALAALVLSLPCAFSADEPDQVRFIRVDQDDSAARLQTAVTRYEKDGTSVELIGAIHIADKAYYDTLNKRFDGYDSLLFEMVGGEKFGRPQDPPPQKPAKADPKNDKAKPGQSVLHQIYKLTAGFLGLTGQMEHIKYDRPNFVHADLTQAEFDKMQADRGESLLGFALKNAQAGRKNGAKQPDPEKLLNAMLSGKSNLMKLELIETLGGAEDQIGALAGESVILTDRNARCMAVLARELKAGRKNLGVFYGAAHFVDLSKQLEKDGFRRVKQEWLTAWDVPKPKKEGQKAEPPAGELKDAA